MAYKRRVGKLNRTKGAKEALVSQLALSVIERGVIETSEARGRVLSGFFDRLMSGRGSDQNFTRRIVKLLRLERGSVGKILKNLEQIPEGKRSGFLRIVRLGRRSGDGSMRIKVELIRKEEKSDESKRKKVEEITEVPDSKKRNVNTQNLPAEY